MIEETNNFVLNDQKKFFCFTFINIPRVDQLMKYATLLDRILSTKKRIIRSVALQFNPNCLFYVIFDALKLVYNKSI